MAEGTALSSSDLFEKDAFRDAQTGAAALLAILKETQSTIKGTIEHQKNFVTSFKAKNYDDVKQLNTAIAETNALIKQKELITKSELAVEQQSEKLAQAKLKTQREEIKNQNELAKQNKATEKSLNSLNGEYTKGVKQLAEIKKQLKELEFTGRNNGKVFKALTQEFNSLNGSVRGAEEKVGEFQRNVGNYSSGFNGLNNSINQISREMPAFANSMQTGFMAISNNIPALFDEITRLKKANIELAASGQPVKSTFSSVVGAIFSWQTALSVGVTLLTVFGAKIVSFIGSLFESEKAFQQSTKSIEENTKAIDANKAAIAALQAQLDSSVQSQLQQEGKLNDLDKARIDAMAKYQSELDNIEKAKKDEAKTILETNAETIKDEEDRAKFLEKLDVSKLRNFTVVLFKAQELRIRSSKEEVQIFTETNNQLLRLKRGYDLRQKKAAELLEQEIAAAKIDFDKKEVEAVKKKTQAKIKEITDLESEIRTLEIAVIKDEQDRQRAQLYESFRIEQLKITASNATAAKKAETLIALENKLNFDLAEIDRIAEEKRLKFALEKQNEFANLYQKYLDDLENKRLKAAQNEQSKFAKLWAIRRKQLQDEADAEKEKTRTILNELDKIEKAVEKGIAIKNKRVNDALNREAELNKTAIDTQQRLAEKGLENTLAFEKEKAAKLELERKRQAEKEIRQQKVFAFYNLFSNYAKTDPNTALQKAIVDTALAEVISGSFIDGTESVERDLKGNKVHSGQDGYVVRVDGGERILNPKQNDLIGNISNDDLVGIVNDFQSGSYSQKLQTVANIIDMTETNILLQSLVNKPVHQTRLDNLGQVIETTISNGITRVVTHKRKI